MGVFGGKGEAEKLNYVYVADLQHRQFPPQDFDCRQGFLGGHITGGGHHHIGVIHAVCAAVIAGPRPEANAPGHMAAGGLQIQILQVFLLV